MVSVIGGQCPLCIDTVWGKCRSSQLHRPMRSPIQAQVLEASHFGTFRCFLVCEDWISLLSRDRTSWCWLLRVGVVWLGSLCIPRGGCGLSLHPCLDNPIGIQLVLAINAGRIRTSNAKLALTVKDTVFPRINTHSNSSLPRIACRSILTTIVTTGFTSTYVRKAKSL